MTFRTYDKARRRLVAAGVTAAPVVIALHILPHDEHLDALPAAGTEHVPHESHQPTSMRQLVMFETSATSSSAGVSLADIFRIPDRPR
jgi:hypothetical protein